MAKTFQEQLLPILEERFRNSASEVKRHLKEASTPAAQTLIKYIRQWEFKSRNVALARLIECDRWNDKGELVLERNFKGKEYSCKMPLAMAWECYVYGDQRTQVVPMYSFANHVKKIPANITKDWAEEVKGLFNDINRMTVGAFKIIDLGKCVKSYGVGNPYTFSEWDRHVSDFKEAQVAIDIFVVPRKGWEYLTTSNLQNPEHGEAMSKILEDILAKADEMVEPSVKAIREQDRKMYIRQDATHARNNVKKLRAFFKKYGPADSCTLAGGANILDSIGGEIDEVEIKLLTKS